MLSLAFVKEQLRNARRGIMTSCARREPNLKRLSDLCNQGLGPGPPSGSCPKKGDLPGIAHTLQGPLRTREGDENPARFLAVTSSLRTVAITSVRGLPRTISPSSENKLVNTQRHLRQQP